MKISYKGDYALKTMMDLSLYYDQPRTIADIAGNNDIPAKFLEQIMLDLKKGGFVKSQRGRYGGYVLARKPEKIILGEVIRFVDGPIEPISCICKKGASQCEDAAACVLRDVFLEVTELISSKIDKLNFSQLRELQKKKAIRKNKYLDYVI